MSEAFHPSACNYAYYNLHKFNQQHQSCEPEQKHHGSNYSHPTPNYVLLLREVYTAILVLAKLSSTHRAEAKLASYQPDRLYSCRLSYLQLATADLISPSELLLSGMRWRPEALEVPGISDVD